MYNCTATFTACGAHSAQLRCPAPTSICAHSRKACLQTARNAPHDVRHVSMVIFGGELMLIVAEARVARSARALKIGTLRPAIVLYDEPHPLGDDIGTIQTSDMARKPDMLIIMGTSLKVHGLKKLVKDFAKVVHVAGTGTTPNGSPKAQKSWQGKVVFVNKTPPGGEWSNVIDYHVEGETDEWVEKVLEDWKKMRPSDWEIQQTLDKTGETGGFKIVKDAVTKKKGKGENGFSSRSPRRRLLSFDSRIQTQP